MPAEFRRFHKVVPEPGAVNEGKPREAKLKELDDGPGEQEFPVVLATESGGHAMGVFSPDQPSAGFEKAGYGRFRFKDEKVVKWNCVFRRKNTEGIAAGEYRFRVFVAVGTVEDVRWAIEGLGREFGGK